MSSPPPAIGRYQVLREVARGGMGVVYRARGPDGQDVALKLLLAGANANPLQRRRVQTEIQTLLRLRHPHVVALLDAGEHEGVPWLAMEWIEGESLADRLQRLGPLDPRDAANLVRRLCAAIEHCHQREVLHRDLKPHNVLLRRSDGEPLLTDFGLSKDTSNDSSLDRSVTGRWLGTPGYWPPEQAGGDLTAIGPWSDVYGLGAILYACLTGLPPQEGSSLYELLASLERPPLPPSQRRRGVPRWLDEVCLRALEREPPRRPPSAGHLARELEAGLARLEARPRRRAARLALAGALGLLAATALGVALLRGRAAPPVEVVVTSFEPRGAVRSRAEQQAETLSVFERAIAQDPLDAKAWWGRGTIRQDRGEWEAALEDYDRAIELDPAGSPAYANRGYIRLQRADSDAALRDLDRAVKLAPSNAEVLANRGVARFNRGELDQARNDFDRAIELAPHRPATWCNRAALRQNRGDLSGALADYDRALALDDGLVTAHYNRAKLRRERGDREGARADYDRAVELAPDDPLARCFRAAARLEWGDLPGALADYDRAVALDPGLSWAFSSRGYARERLPDLAGARADYDRAIELDPRDAAALRARGAVRARTNDAAGALQDLDRAIELDPADELAWLNRGVVRIQQGALPAALADLERAIALKPGAADAYFYRAYLLEVGGEAARARADLERFLKLAPSHPQAAAARAALERLGELR